MCNHRICRENLKIMNQLLITQFLPKSSKSSRFNFELRLGDTERKTIIWYYENLSSLILDVTVFSYGMCRWNKNQMYQFLNDARWYSTNLALLYQVDLWRISPFFRFNCIPRVGLTCELLFKMNMENFVAFLFVLHLIFSRLFIQNKSSWP